jgi:hypothetical protein
MRSAVNPFHLSTEARKVTMDSIRWKHLAERVNGTRLHYVTGGDGPPLYLLHGYPQTCHLWRKVAPS